MYIDIDVCKYGFSAYCYYLWKDTKTIGKKTGPGALDIALRAKAYSDYWEVQSILFLS